MFERLLNRCGPTWYGRLMWSVVGALGFVIACIITFGAIWLVIALVEIVLPGGGY